MAHEVFISYSSRDKKTVVGAICPSLETAGASCWVAPRDIPPGATWAEAISAAIEDCRVFIVVLSEASRDSPDVFREVALAADQGVPILTFRFQEVEPTRRMGYYLKPTQWLDGFVPPFRARVGELTETVLGLLEPPPRTEEVPEESARPPRFRRRRLALIALTSGAVVAALVVGLLLAIPRDTESSSTTTALAESTVASGGVTTTTPSTEVKEKWRFYAGAPVRYTPAIGVGLVFFSGTDSRLYAVATANGKEEWSQEIGSGADAPVVSDGLVYLGASEASLGRSLYALDADNGQLQWTSETRLPGVRLWCSLVSDGVVYARGGSGSLYTLNAGTGRAGWEFQTFHSVTGAAAAGGVIYFRSNDGYLYAVDTDTGVEKWRFRTGGPSTYPPAVGGALVYFEKGHVVYAVYAASGREAWRFEAEQTVRYALAVADGAVYFGSYDGSLYAVDAQGREEWRFKPGGGVSSSPAIAGGVVYFGCDDHCLYAIDTETGEEKWRYTTGGMVLCTPAIADGVVYFGSDDGYLYAVAIP